ncbi:Uma2 family endonuclease [Kribbella qitaiheensis]|uniref:Uma2 family endonuclease n=1 Tax=Kribbella qitaiheensis TaxID=1544730 RepID=A0A7G6X4J4_9ACTN|nr:Uma2 family endonuclease [Kribbella qitaiheensis]QNE21159.1 Uma2 family endonuclease [Kribbella qitaiheensis]
MVLMQPDQLYNLPWRPNLPLTRDDLDRMPDDGHRYELIDGALIMTPAPSLRHQSVVVNLVCLLKAACPRDLKVLVAPFDVVLAPDSIMQPDLLVARSEDFTERELPTAPLLAVEVLSPSTRRIDLMLKFSRLEAAGCASYWVVDPDTPELIAWEMRDGAYAQVAKVAGDDEARLTLPFGVTVVPADLIL